MFPRVYYTLNDGASIQVIPDITRRINILDEYKNNNSMYDPYDVQEGETPEILSDIFYGTPLYHWIILHMNDVLDPRYDWPLTQEALFKHVVDKYGGEDEIYKVKLYTNQADFVVNGYRTLDEKSVRTPGRETYIVYEDGSSLLLRTPPFTIYPVSRLEYETAINESKRRIKLLKPEAVSFVVNQFADQIVK